jgi:hypothetical protein
MINRINSDCFNKQLNRLIIVMESCCVSFEEQTGFLNITDINKVLQSIKDAAS